MGQQQQHSSSLPAPYLDLQARLRDASSKYARTQMWCRRPQNQNDKLGAYFKPRVSILIRPPFIKTGEARTLTVGSGEVLFHIFGVFDEVGFIADPHYRTICGEKSPLGLVSLIDAKLERYEPGVSAHLYHKQYDAAVELLYLSVRESIICARSNYDFY